MNQQKINYIVMAGLCILALILGYFGVTLPITPEIPSPLPTPTPVDLSGYVAHEELALLQRQIETLSVTGDGEPTSFGAYQTNCWMEEGGNQWTAGSGCVWEVQSGATLDVQSGATVTLTNVAVTTQTASSLTVGGVLDAQGTIINSTGTLTVNDHLDVANTLNYGTSNLYPLGSEDSNFQLSWGSDTITGSLQITQKVGTPTVAWCTMNQQLTDNEEQKCSAVIVGTDVTIYVYKEDGSAGDSGAVVGWLVIGIP